ncbi:unnamed protein product [Bursaphelenchus okinawaensis]|uniref:Uncharacterized protein n=1 Tax=Bursaphelenchus okinawaensis TaxID=465554 RepID=A0A811KGA7_9BILA|nr:unnamed protein product [Bursaphelenchus okinawaensis]CAG9102868.1 unnamed protein product [Bursaphelenchus okinawaensis]
MDSFINNQFGVRPQPVVQQQWNSEEMSESDLNNIMAYENMNQGAEKVDEEVQEVMEVDEDKENLDYDVIPDFDLSVPCRKLYYERLVSSKIKWKEKLKALVNLLKLDLEDHTSYFMVRNTDMVIQIGIDQFGGVATCYMSWFGAPLRPNEQIRQLISHDNWVVILRVLKVMNNLIPHSVVLTDRVLCLNALLILEHDLTLLFKKGRLFFKQNEPVNFWPRSDLQPFTISLDWRSGHEPNALGTNDGRYTCQLNILFSSSIQTSFPTQSCLNDKLNWIEVPLTRPVNASYCLTFPTAIPVASGLMKMLLAINGGLMAVANKTNWWKEASDQKMVPKIIFGSKKKCLTCLFKPNNEDEQGEDKESDKENKSEKEKISELKDNDKKTTETKEEDFLVKKITVFTPQAVAEVLRLLFDHMKIFGLAKQLINTKNNTSFGVKRSMLTQIQVEKYNQLSIEVDSERFLYGRVTITASNGRLNLFMNINSVLGGRLLSKPVTVHIDKNNLEQFTEFDVTSEERLNQDWSILYLLLNIINYTEAETQKKYELKLLKLFKNNIFNSHYKRSPKVTSVSARKCFKLLKFGPKRREFYAKATKAARYRMKLVIFLTKRQILSMDFNGIKEAESQMCPSNSLAMIRRHLRIRKARLLKKNMKKERNSTVDEKTVTRLAKIKNTEGFAELQKVMKSSSSQQKTNLARRKRSINILKKSSGVSLESRFLNPVNLRRYSRKAFGRLSAWRGTAALAFRRQKELNLKKGFDWNVRKSSVSRFNVEKNEKKLPDLKDMFKISKMEALKKKFSQSDMLKAQNQGKKQDPYSRYPDFTNMPPPQTKSIFPMSQMNPTAVRPKMELPMTYSNAYANQDEEDSSDDNETDPPPPPKVPANNNQVYQPHLLAARNERLNKVKQDQKERELEQQKLKASQQSQLQRAARINQIGQRLSLNAEQSETALKATKMEVDEPSIPNNQRKLSKEVKTEAEQKTYSPSIPTFKDDVNADFNTQDESNSAPPQLESNKEIKRPTENSNSSFPSPDSLSQSPPPSLTKSDEDSKGPPVLTQNEPVRREEDSPRPVKREEDKDKKESRKAKDEKRKEKKEKEVVLKKEKEKRDERRGSLVTDIDDKKIKKERDDTSTSSSSSIKSRIASKPTKEAVKKDSKEKRKPKEVKEHKLREPSPATTRKRSSPTPAKKKDREEPKKKEEKLSDKSKTTKYSSREETRLAQKRPSTSVIDDKRKKIRKTSDRTVEKDKVERKDSTSSSLQDVLGSMGRPTISSLRNFKIPKVVEPEPKPQEAPPLMPPTDKKEKSEASTSAPRDDRRDNREPREPRENYREYNQNYSGHSTGKMFFEMPSYGTNRPPRRGSMKGTSQGSFDGTSTAPYRQRKGGDPMKSPTFPRNQSGPVVPPYARDKPPNANTQLGHGPPLLPASFHQSAAIPDKQPARDFVDKDFRDQREPSPVDGLQIDED